MAADPQVLIFDVEELLSGRVGGNIWKKFTSAGQQFAGFCGIGSGKPFSYATHPPLSPPAGLCGHAAAIAQSLRSDTDWKSDYITVQNTGTATSRLESSASMSAGTWTAVAGAAFAPVSGQAGFHRDSDAGGGEAFYRVVGIALADDTDGCTILHR